MRVTQYKLFDWLAEILINQKALFCDVGTAAASRIFGKIDYKT
jgi:hypothetical protein